MKESCKDTYPMQVKGQRLQVKGYRSKVSWQGEGYRKQEKMARASAFLTFDLFTFDL
jgi:hypothetical protein